MGGQPPLVSVQERQQHSVMAKGPGRRGNGGKVDNDKPRILADNRFARHQYDILEILETGVELLGTEVKSVRAGQTNLRDGFCLIRNGPMQLHNVHTHPTPTPAATSTTTSVRRLLAHRKEINKLRLNWIRRD